MMIKTFTLRFMENIDGFDDEPVRAFMADKEIVAVDKKFFLKDGSPYWTVILTYKPGGSKPATDAQAKGGGAARDQKKEDPKASLKDDEIPLYNRLREWRRDRANKDGVPAYVVFHNKQVAKIAAKKPRSFSQLSAIEGVGRQKIGISAPSISETGWSITPSATSNTYRMRRKFFYPELF